MTAEYSAIHGHAITIYDDDMVYEVLFANTKREVLAMFKTQYPDMELN